MSTPLSIENFQILRQLSPALSLIGTVPTLQHIINMINEANAQQMIANPMFIELKNRLGRMLDSINFNNRKDKVPADDTMESVRSWAYRLNLNLEFYQPGHAAGKIKLMDKFHRYNTPSANSQLYRAFLVEVSILSDAVTALKPFVVKRQPKPADDPTKAYIAPMAAKAAGAKVIAVLTALTEEIKIEYIAAVKAQLIRDCNRAYELRETPKEYREFCMFNGMTSLTWKVFEKTNSGLPLTWKEGWEAEVNKEATDAGDFMQQQFLFKNAKKLAKIVELKDNLTECEPIGKPHVLSGGIRGEIVMRFADGSQCDVHNTVKWNRSVHGKIFNQFPTTFHNVVMPGHIPMESPSEQRMIEVFAVAKA